MTALSDLYRQQASKQQQDYERALTEPAPAPLQGQPSGGGIWDSLFGSGGGNQNPGFPGGLFGGLFGGGSGHPSGSTGWKQMQGLMPPPPGQKEQTVKIQVEAPPMNGQQPMPPQQGQSPIQPPQGAAPPPAPYPQPPQGGPASPYQPTKPPPAVPPATPPQNPQYPGGGGGGRGPNAGPAPQQPPTGNWSGWNPSEKNQYGDQTIAGADPSQADYDSVQGYSDQAHDAARRYLDPQQDTENRRLQQELINKGVDPNSAQGQRMMDDLGMRQADANNAASFNALQFGQGIQNQMFGQEQQQAQLAGDMQKALWQNQLGASGQSLQKYLGDQSSALGWGNLQSQHQLGQAGLDLQGKLGMGNLANQRYGMDQNFQLGKSGQDLQRYGMDQNYQLGQSGQDIQRQQNEWNQMMGGQDREFQYQQYNDMLSRGDQRYNDQMLMSLLNFNKPGGSSQIDPSGFGQALLSSAGQDKGWLGSLFG